MQILKNSLEFWVFLLFCSFWNDLITLNLFSCFQNYLKRYPSQFFWEVQVRKYFLFKTPCLEISRSAIEYYSWIWNNTVLRKKWASSSKKNTINGIWKLRKVIFGILIKLFFRRITFFLRSLLLLMQGD